MMILLFFKIAFMYKSYVQSLLLYNICMYLTFYDIFTTYRVINKQFGIEFEKVLVMRMLFLLGPIQIYKIIFIEMSCFPTRHQTRKAYFDEYTVHKYNEFESVNKIEMTKQTH